ncbi:MAG: hypothetical protein KDI15_03550 [Thiothrix sp.]|nr:hypothetical protein [Thiothrix sp.]HPE59397.1 hypothetical protein [Thiolinea sp.]
MLLPWYLTGRLSGEEKGVFEQALTSFPELQQELGRERQIMELVRENTSLLELSALDTTRQRLDKVLGRIDAEAGATAVSESMTAQQGQRPSAADAPVRSRFADWFDRLFRQPLFFNWLTPANAVFACLLAVQLGLLGMYLYSQPAGKEMVVYQSASAKGSGGTDSLPGAGHLLVIRFEDGIAYEKVFDFLRQTQSHIVAGPDQGNTLTVDMGARTHDEAVLLGQQLMTDFGGVVATAGAGFSDRLE